MRPSLLIRGQWGLGDNIFARPIVRACAEKYDVWLETPWPELFEDLPIRFVAARRDLRTQMRNVARQSPARWSTPPNGIREIRLGYGNAELARGSIVAALERQVAAIGVPLSAPCWDLPDMGAPLVLADRPIALVRPVTVRSEWRNEARNPRPEYVAAIARELTATHHVVVVADLQDGREWLEGVLPPHHQAFLRGELVVRELLALVGAADVVVGGVGWIVPAAIALGRRAFVIHGGHGGHNARHVITDPRMNLSRIGFATPRELCKCTDKLHQCDKSIPDLAAQWAAFCSRVGLNSLTPAPSAA
ncbi:hypothetical protein G6321_00025180 [Bradyrhizobium barranii subsp. barranii]|uniref:Glycosyltransferase family 9 protein n=2 Tax=Bradyrhizobium TaxID=374 RepID=A0A7Z0QI97_9BRAD|nr:hypothetical protein [Bradyrhizobium barranii]UEM17338.1 hypothetical protein J4G43_025750 [Bradyrhizobium barranii subsp. barranii]UGX98239.1 hypothetical protein G6321_00025180 [Bradyrhizobium barranii subsp. barranii]